MPPPLSLLPVASQPAHTCERQRECPHHPQMAMRHTAICCDSSSLGSISPFTCLQTQALRPRRPGTSVKTAKMPKSACFRRVPKVIWCLWAESLKRVSRTVQTLRRTGGSSLKQGFALCKGMAWDSHPGGPKTCFALSLSTFGWAFWPFRHLYQAGGVATQAVQECCFPSFFVVGVVRAFQEVLNIHHKCFNFS